MTTIFGGINTMARALDFHLERQNLIAGNIANVDTPGYVPKELTRVKRPLPGEFSIAMFTSDNQHIQSNGPGGDPAFDVLEEKNVIPGNDLNYVSLEQEMARLSANGVRFEVVEKLVSRHLGMLSYAVTDGRK